MNLDVLEKHKIYVKELGIEVVPYSVVLKILEDISISIKAHEKSLEEVESMVKNILTQFEN